MCCWCGQGGGGLVVIGRGSFLPCLTLACASENKNYMEKAILKHIFCTYLALWCIQIVSPPTYPSTSPQLTSQSATSLTIGQPVVSVIVTMCILIVFSVQGYCLCCMLYARKPSGTFVPGIICHNTSEFIQLSGVLSNIFSHFYKVINTVLL